MSVLVTIKMIVDVDTFRRALSERSGEFVKNSERGRESGAVHHQFGVGDGYVLVVDEWESAEKFQAFFSDPELQKFIGEVGGNEKDAFLRDAAALLFPIRWPEPFGLVMAEALACGTPVVALRAGSVPEVIDHGRTGFIVADEDELVQAVHQLGSVDRERCRAEAVRRFSAGRMTEQCERVYEWQIRRARAANRRGVA